MTPAPLASTQLLRDLYNAFDPLQPLPAGDPAYMDCRSVRGDANVLVDLGKKVIRSDRVLCQLYAGHRGTGKSTELLRLKADLEQKGCFVVYFAADNDDIDPENVEYTDILLTCTRHLLEQLNTVDAKPVLNWLRDRWDDLKSLALTEIEFDKLTLEAQITQFAKLTSSIRAIPSQREQIRQKVNPHTITLLNALNEFIANAQNKLPDGKTRLVVIADNLDRIVLISQGDRTNHDEIFLDRSQQLQGLQCHTIYTIPISMVYSSRASDLRDIYGDPQLLPMIMVKTPDEQPYGEGIQVIKQMIQKRIQPFVPDLTLDRLETDIFANKDILDRLCGMSGGHVRNVMLLIRSAMDYIDQLPITEAALRRSITQARDTYRRTVESQEWELLAKVAQTKRIDNNDESRKLLFTRCVLHYCYFDDQGELQPWYDVHPLIYGIQQFQDAMKNQDTMKNIV